MWACRALVVYIIATSGGRPRSDLCLRPKRANYRLRTGFDNRHVRLAASRVILGFALRAAELEDLAARVEVLERQMEEAGEERWQ